MKNNLPKYTYSIASIKGIKPINEDCAWVGCNKSNQYLAIVCDGISSEKGSELASKTIVNYFRSAFLRKFMILWPQKWVRHHLNKAYLLLKQKTYEQKISVGTTLVMALFTGHRVHVFNLGDSRLYYMSSLYHRTEQVTLDHNLYNHLEKIHAPQSVFIKNKKMLLALTRYIDSSTKQNMNFDHYCVYAKKGDLFLLATDGLYNYIDVKHIYTRSVYLNDDQFKDLSGVLCNEAMENNSNDNITGVLLKVNK